MASYFLTRLRGLRGFFSGGFASVAAFSASSKGSGMRSLPLRWRFPLEGGSSAMAIA